MWFSNAPIFAGSANVPAVIGVATTPGASYQVEMAAWSPASSLPASRYTVRATYTALPDPTEPNDTRFDAKTITVGTPVQAYTVAE